MPCHSYIWVPSSCTVYPGLAHYSSISETDCPFYDNDLLACLVDYDTVAVHCYAIPHTGQHKLYTNIAKISIHTQVLPHLVHFGLSDYMDPFFTNVRSVVILATQPNTVAPGLNHLNCPAQSCMYASCGCFHNSFNKSCPGYKLR